MAQRTNRIIFNILAKDIEETARFYEALCGLERQYTSDWYIVLTPGGDLAYELGIIDEVSEFVPTAARGLFAGGYLTLVVDDVRAAHARARDMDVDIVSPPTATDYGQIQMILRDPNGVVVDISTPAQ
jgi:catechol 2,3-dioxygenase-like lactoylglutathione lyase family enzyme